MNIVIIVLNISQKNTFFLENWRNLDTKWMIDDNRLFFRDNDGIGTMLKRILSYSHSEVFIQILNYLQI